MAKITPEVWQLRQENDDLKERIDALENEKLRLRRERDTAIRERLADQEEAISLRNQLAAKTDEARRLHSLLDETRLQLATLASESGDASAQVSAKQEELTRVKVELLTATARIQSEHLANENLTANGRKLQDELQQLRTVREENNFLTGQNKYLKTAVDRLKSQVGNFLVGTGKIPFTYYALEVANKLPLIGSLFQNASINAYEAYRQRK